MNLSIAYLGPTGTNTETAALAYVKHIGGKAILCPCTSITQALHSVALKQAHLAVVPVENSIEGSVAITLDIFWRLDSLRIQQALTLPIAHTLYSYGEDLTQIETVYSHPQALAQCQEWLEEHIPGAKLVPTSSTTEALKYLEGNPRAAAIASPRAAQLYNIPILEKDLKDYPDNCTRFWVVGLNESIGGKYISLAFSVPANVPGSLVRPLQVFAQRNINLVRIESRPTKRALGEYLFFIDLDASCDQLALQNALQELANHTSILKIFGSYNVLTTELI